MISNSLRVKAVNFRRKGKSYNFISNSLNIPKSTLSNWFGKVAWSSSVKELLIEKSKKTSSLHLKRLNKIRQSNLKNLYLKAITEADEEFISLKKSSLFISGIFIYWGEGDRVFKNGQVRVSNIDSRMLLIFKRFLEKSCRILSEKIKGHIIIYDDLSSDECLRFWSKNVKIPKVNFSKPVMIKGRSEKRSPYGICTVQISNKFLKRKILRWIDLSADEIN